MPDLDGRNSIFDRFSTDRKFSSIKAWGKFLVAMRMAVVMLVGWGGGDWSRGG